jgi:hypothetical protein
LQPTTSSRPPRAPRIAARFLIAAAAATCIALADARIPDASIQLAGEEYVPEPATAKLLSFGFDAVMSDLAWMRAIQIVGSDSGAIGKSHTLAALIDLVTSLDPWVDHPYRFAAVWINDDEAAVRKANALIRRGIEHHPDDWRGYFHLGFNYFFYLDEQTAAADALEPALALEGRPRYLGRLVSRLRSESGGLDASAAFLSQMVADTDDVWELAGYKEALKEIETERRARFLDEARVEFVRRHGRDIESLDDLVRFGVLIAVPEEPFGAGWELSPETGEVVSKRLRYRYGVRIDQTNRALLEKFRERSREKRRS